MDTVKETQTTNVSKWVQTGKTQSRQPWYKLEGLWKTVVIINTKVIFTHGSTAWPWQMKMDHYLDSVLIYKYKSNQYMHVRARTHTQ